MKRTAICLPEQQIQRLKRAAQGRTVSELIRAAIEDYLLQQENGFRINRNPQSDRETFPSHF
jgi:predicted DNA-binding protein